MSRWWSWEGDVSHVKLSDKDDKDGKDEKDEKDDKDDVSHVKLSDKTGGSAGNSVKCETLCWNMCHTGSYLYHMLASYLCLSTAERINCDILNACCCYILNSKHLKGHSRECIRMWVGTTLSVTRIKQDLICTFPKVADFLVPKICAFGFSDKPNMTDSDEHWSGVVICICDSVSAKFQQIQLWQL